MFRILFQSLLLASLLSVPAWAKETGYAAAIEDLPLMAGMAELPRETLYFDTPQGRIVETAADTPRAAPAVAAFYAETLPALGWRAEAGAGGMAYTRGGERLTLALEPAGAGTRARFTIAPGKGG